MMKISISEILADYLGIPVKMPVIMNVNMNMNIHLRASSSVNLGSSLALNQTDTVETICKIVLQNIRNSLQKLFRWSEKVQTTFSFYERCQYVPDIFLSGSRIVSANLRLVTE